MTNEEILKNMNRFNGRRNSHPERRMRARLREILEYRTALLSRRKEIGG